MNEGGHWTRKLGGAILMIPIGTISCFADSPRFRLDRPVLEMKTEPTAMNLLECFVNKTSGGRRTIAAPREGQADGRRVRRLY
jgi:hypothetical protein